MHVAASLHHVLNTGLPPRLSTHLQALEAVKVVGGVGDVLAQKLLIFDALAGVCSV